MRADAERRLRPSRPLHLRLTLGPLRRGPADPTMRVRDSEVWRAHRTRDGAATTHLAMSAGGEVLARAWGRGADIALADLETLLGEADDSAGLVPAHRAVEEARQRLVGMRMCRSEAVFDALVGSVLEQKVTGGEAHHAWYRMVHALGDPAPGDAGLVLPVEPGRLARTPWWAFHSFGIERGRADLLRRLGAVAPRLEEITRMPAAEARARLLAVRGVGPWTAAEVALAALGDADAVSVGDYHLPHLTSWALAGEPRGSDERMLELLEPYRGHRGRVLRLLAASGMAAPRRGPRMPERDIARM